jgi:hypothetical protein
MNEEDYNIFGNNKNGYLDYKEFYLNNEETHNTLYNKLVDEYSAYYDTRDNVIDNTNLTSEQIKFINTLLRTTALELSPTEVTLLKKIEREGEYSEYESARLNKIRTRYIEWLQQKK